ncbi:MAG TPA: carbohydrate ABC transporter permease, partial [Candidatus Deferrimicrobiaceae bacterium]
MSEERRNRLLYGAGVLATAVFCLVPVVYMVLTAASGRPDFLAPGVEFSPTLAHFRDLLGTESLRFPAYLRNSLIVSGASSLLCIAVASPAAYAITRFSLPGRMTILFLVLAVSMFPQISLVSYLFRVMGDLGWINTLPALILPYTAWTLPLSLWILTSYFSRVPKDLDRAAQVDGCGQLGVLLRVVLPVAAPGIFSTGILAFLFAFNEFLFA